MTVGSWNPDAAATTGTAIDRQLLQQFADLSRSEQLDQLDTAVSQETVEAQAGLMRSDAEAWTDAAAALDNSDIWHLIRFFTRAEEQLPGWQAGAKSPVIWLHRVLKQRGAPLTKEQLLWIRAHSNNRYLPNGAL